MPGNVKQRGMKTAKRARGIAAAHPAVGQVVLVEQTPGAEPQQNPAENGREKVGHGHREDHGEKGRFQSFVRLSPLQNGQHDHDIDGPSEDVRDQRGPKLSAVRVVAGHLERTRTH